LRKSGGSHGETNTQRQSALGNVPQGSFHGVTCIVMVLDLLTVVTTNCY
jgi:hypothetical protein